MSEILISQMFRELIGHVTYRGRRNDTDSSEVSTSQKTEVPYAGHRKFNVGAHKIRKPIIAAALIGTALLSTACFEYNRTGSNFGYITAVEEGKNWSAVHMLADYTSSKESCFQFEMDDDGRILAAKLRKASIDKERVELVFKRTGTSIAHIDSCSSYYATDVKPIVGTK